MAVKTKVTGEKSTSARSLWVLEMSYKSEKMSEKKDTQSTRVENGEKK